MKQTIEYYYSLSPIEIFSTDGAYYFEYNRSYYYFVYYNRGLEDLKDIIECSKELKQKNIVCHDIIINNQNEVLTRIDDCNYILLRVNEHQKECSIIDIIEQNKQTKLSSIKSTLYRNDWAHLWETKIDYIENQLNEILVDKIISKSVDYYIGLAENAISYINAINQKYSISLSDNVVLSHKRIYYPNLGLNYYNPLSYIFDLEVRDVAEYIKSMFFANEDALLELTTYLKCTQLTQYSYNMLWARLLYPSYYFDVYEKVVNHKMDSEKLIVIIKNNGNYENFLKKAYKEISLYAKLEKINWLIS